MANGEDQLTQQQIEAAEAERDRLRLENMSALGATLNSLGQGFTFGYGDEIGASVAALVKRPFSDKTLGEIYEHEVEEARGLIKAGQEKYPWLSLGAEIAGGIPTGLGLWKAGSALLKNAPRLARLAGLGAVEGGIYGSGIAEEGARLEGGSRGAGWGAALGPVGAGVGHAVSRGYQKLIAPTVRAFTQTPKAEARRLLQLAMERDDMTILQAEREMAELGPEAMLADIHGGNVVGLARAVAGQPGRAKSIGERLLHNRQGSQQQRILEAAGVAPDDVGTFRMRVYQMINDRKTKSGPLYQKAYQTVLEPDELRTFTITKADGETQQITTSLSEILKIFPRDTVSNARVAMRQDMDLLDEIKSSFPDTAEGRESALKIFNNPDTSSLRFYDYIQRELKTYDPKEETFRYFR